MPLLPEMRDNYEYRAGGQLGARSSPNKAQSWPRCRPEIVAARVPLGESHNMQES